MRHAADEWKWMTSLGMSKGCKLADQDMLLEVLASAVAGRPVWKDALDHCAENRTNPIGLTLMRQHEAVQKFIGWDLKCQASDL